MSQKRVSMVLYVLLVLACMFTLGYLVGKNHSSREIQVTVAAPVQTVQQPSGTSEEDTIDVIDLNTAGREQLETLPGIGEELADRIIAYRGQIGGFSNKQQIMEVEGIGEKKYAEMEKLIKVGGAP